MSRVDHDVVIVGAGLVGLALAVALARAGLSVALADRGNVATAETPPTATWDARIRDQSGQRRVSAGQGAWQTLPAERVAAVKRGNLRRRGRTVALPDLGERALAWIVENRAQRALVATVRTESLSKCWHRVPRRRLACRCRRAALPPTVAQ
jgi:2-polyprenyl-6-methoxyphenol hydroxylase-like FAD-dependent oxidoreductase